MASLLHSRFLLSPGPSSPSDRLHTSLIIGFTAGALSAALACLLFFSIHHCMFHLRRRRHQRDPPSLPPAPGLLLLDAIPVTVYGSPEEEEEEEEKTTGGAGGEDACCSVCLEDYHGGEEVRVLPRCGHVFHKDCIDPWLLTAASRVCPVCRGLVFEAPVPAAEAESARNGEAVLLHNVGLAPQQLLL